MARDDCSLLCTAAYCLIGVPVFGCGASKLVTVWLEWRIVEKVKQSVENECLSQDTFIDYALSLDYVTAENPKIENDPQQVMDLAEYICMELRTLGLVQQDVLKVIVDRFIALDEDHSGFITLDEAKNNFLIGARASMIDEGVDKKKKQ